MSTDVAGAVMSALGVVLVVIGILILNGKATFLISGYKRYDKNKTDFEKVHWTNGGTTIVIGALVAIAGIALRLTGERLLSYVCLAAAATVYLGLFAYEKTGDRYRN